MKEIIISKYFTLSGDTEILQIEDSEEDLCLNEASRKISERDIMFEDKMFPKKPPLNFQEQEDLRDFWYGSYWNSNIKERTLK